LPDSKMQTNELVIFWNCARGVFNKKCFIEQYINNFKPMAFFISECDVTGDHCKDLLKVAGYELEIAPTIISRNKGRLMVYFKSGLNIKRISTLENEPDNLIVLDSQKVLLVGLYSGFQTYEDETVQGNFERLLESASRSTSTRKKLIIGGDFNCDLNRNDSKSKVIKLWSASNGLSQLVEGITRHRVVNDAVQESSIDLVYTNDPIDLEVRLENSSVSDHKLLIVETKIKIQRPTTKKSIVIDWRRFNEGTFCDLS